MERIFIPGELYSKKNSKQWTGRHLISSPKVREYEKSALPLYVNQKKIFLNMVEGKKYPLRVHFRPIRMTKRLFDYNNIIQIVQDMMVKAEWLPDDNMKYLIPVIEEYGVDKHNPGVEIWVE